MNALGKMLIGKYGLPGSLIILAILSILVFQRQQNTGYFNWRSKMWGDAAGYYVYSPALFIYGFDASEFPRGIVEKTGEGFIINENGKIVTRYSCGVAILQAPVFLAVHLYASLTGLENDGFSGVYHSVSSIAAIIYSFLGLLMLWYFLRERFKKPVVFLTLATVFWGTNLLYYSIDATGMSHIYSFFLFALLLILSHQFFSKSERSKNPKLFVVISIVIAFIVLVRPTNLAFIGLVFLLGINSLEELKSRIKKVFTPVNLLLLFAMFFVVFLPQMLYWNYSSGSFLVDSYQGYGFTNWASPKIKEFLFSTNNGLFPYNPVYFFILASVIYMMVKKQPDGFLIFMLFAGLVYVFSSWFIFSFGCGFGSRNFVEYTSVFALPVGYFYQYFLKRSLLKWALAFPLILAMVFVNVKLTSSYNKCFIDGDWAWEEYSYLMKVKKYNHTVKYLPEISLTNETEFSEPVRIGMDTISQVNFRRAIVRSKIRIYNKDTQSSIVFQITTPDTLLYWNGIGIAEQFSENELGQYKIVKGDFWLPKHYTVNSEISTFVWNMGKDSLDIKEMKIYMK
jgi:hypothetical protein